MKYWYMKRNGKHNKLKERKIQQWKWKKKWNDAMEQAQLQATTLEFRHNKLEEHEEV